MPSVNSRSMPNVWPSSTFTTPSLPTLSIASAITSPISSSAAEMAHTSDLVLAGDLRGDLLDAIDDLVHGLLDAALERQRVRARRHVLQALADDRLGEHGRRGGAVAGHVVGGGRHLAYQLGALVRERILDLDLTGDRHTV